MEVDKTFRAVGTTLGIAAGVLGGEFVGRQIGDRLPANMASSTWGALALDLGMFTLGRYLTGRRSVHLQRLGQGVKVGATLHGISDVLTGSGYYGGDFDVSFW